MGDRFYEESGDRSSLCWDEGAISTLQNLSPLSMCISRYLKSVSSSSD
ncbi:MAG: hypothetical protein ACFE0J_23280 [Elainellaceae cyanobacterium]